jgi:hypothetical protein
LIGVVEKPKKDEIKKKLFRRKIFRWSLISADLGYTSIFLISIFIAILIGPHGYNPYYNAISDLGWSLITPFPILFDIKAYIGSFLLILTVFNVRKKIKDILYLMGNPFRNEATSKKLINSGLLFGIIGAIGYIFVAVFNMDRAGPNGLYHYLFAVVFFGGFISSISIFCFYFLFNKLNFSRIFAIYGLTIPFFLSILWFITGILLFEWLTFFSILGFLLPFQSKRIIQKVLFQINVG